MVRRLVAGSVVSVLTELSQPLTLRMINHVPNALVRLRVNTVVFFFFCSGRYAAHEGRDSRSGGGYAVALLRRKMRRNVLTAPARQSASRSYSYSNFVLKLLMCLVGYSAMKT